VTQVARILAAFTCIAIAAGVGACTSSKAPPPPVEFPMESPYSGVRTLGVAPAINLSGSHDFDSLVVSDQIYSELQQVQGLNVLPLNKTLEAMHRLGIRSLESTQAVQSLAEALGADGLVVPAVTAYDPYNPPTVGMILQMYTPGPSRLVSIGAKSNSATSAETFQTQPVSQVNGIFNAHNQSVLRELQGFARGRTEYDSALREKKFLLDADEYMRFVAHSMVLRLMDVERSRGADR
jgi:hypothetical protein